MSQERFSLICLLFALLALLMQPGIVTAQTVDPSDRVHGIAKRLNCPTCAGRNLADCPTDTCTQWKKEIRSQIETGKTDEQVINYFLDRFGSIVLQEPPREGLLLLVWILPIFGLAALGTGAVLMLRRLHRISRMAISPPDTTTHDDDYTRKLEEEIQA